MSSGEQGPKPVVSSEWDSLADLEAKREELNPNETVDERDDFDADRLKEVYEQQEGESDADYEKRIAGMEEAAKTGTSKVEEITATEQATKENREAAEKLEEEYAERLRRFDASTEQGLADVADVLSGGVNDERYKAVAEKRKADNAKKAEELRARIDEAVKAGTAAELLAKLKEEDRLDDEFEWSQEAGKAGLDGTKDGEVKEAAKDLMKEYFARLDKIEADIKETEEQIKGGEGSIESINKDLDDKKQQAKEGLDKVIEHIDEQENLDDAHKNRLKELAQKRYEAKLKEIEDEHSTSEKEADLSELKAKLEELKLQKEDVLSDLEYVNEEALKQRKEIRDRFNATVSEPGEEERYMDFFKKHKEENYEQLERTGRLNRQKETTEAADEVVEGVAGGVKEDEAKDDSEGQPDSEKAEKMDAKEFLEQLKKWRDDAMREIDEKYNELLKKFNGEAGEDGESSADEEPKDVGDLGAAEVIKNGEVIDGIDFEGLDLDALEDLEKVADMELSDIDAKEKYGVAAHYVANVPIDKNKPVAFYVEQMKSAFADEDLNNEAWEQLEKNMTTRYNNIVSHQADESEPASKDRALDIDAGADAYAETAEGKLEILKGDVDKAKNARAFIRDLELEDIEGLSVEQVMDKVVRPKFFASGFDTAGRTSVKWDKLIDRLNAVYESYGLNSKGERIIDEEADGRRKKKGIAGRIRAMFRRGE